MGASAFGAIKITVFTSKQPIINRAGGGRSYITTVYVCSSFHGVLQNNTLFVSLFGLTCNTEYVHWGDFKHAMDKMGRVEPKI